MSSSKMVAFSAKFMAEEAVVKLLHEARLNHEVHVTKILGDMIGYGNLMNIASALWRKSLKQSGIPETGAFIPVGDFQILRSEKPMVDKMQRHYDRIIEKALQPDPEPEKEEK